MIYDTKEHLCAYQGLSRNLDSAIRFLIHTNFSALPEGRYPIDGKDVFAMVQMPETLVREQCRWESHRNYIDVQYLLSGSEKIGMQNTSSLTVSRPYVPEDDIVFYEENHRGTDFLFVPGSFVVCFPWDAHMPLICPSQPCRIKKVVVKVQVDGKG